MFENTVIESLLDVLLSMPGVAICHLCQTITTRLGISVCLYVWYSKLFQYAERPYWIRNDLVVWYDNGWRKLRLSRALSLIVLWKILILIMVGIPSTFKLQTGPLINWKAEAWYGTDHETGETSSDRDSAADNMLHEYLL
jgi:hypothetical protein